MYFSRKAVEDIIQYATSKGAKPNIFYKKLGKTRTALSAVEYVDYTTIANALVLAVELTEDDFFGLHMGGTEQLKATKQLDQIMTGSFDLEATLSNASKYSKLISDATTSQLVVTHRAFRYEFTLSADWAIQHDIAVRHAIDLALARVKTMVYTLSQGKCQPIAIHFHYPRPKKIEAYYRIFNVPILFNQSKSAIVFSRQYLKHRNPFHNATVLETLRQLADHLLGKLPTDKPLTNKVKKHLYECISPDFLNIGEVAENLNISKRSLQRKLSEEGTSYQKIILDLRMQLAKKYLKEYHMRVDEIAFLLGYSESPAFIRAFKTYYGYTPTTFLHI